jgi:outer membrane protein OmpA-like peptidoglycan-associated protein
MASRRAARGGWRALSALVVGLSAPALQARAQPAAAPAVETHRTPASNPGATPEAADSAATEPADSCIGKALGEDADVILDLVAEAIHKRCAGKRIVIEGHTDVYGDADYNRWLSERRAEAVKDYLVQRGVPAEQLRVEGHGEDSPLTTDPSADAQVLNRRVTLRVDAEGT